MSARRHGGTGGSGCAARRRPLRIVQVVCTQGFAGVERYVCVLARGLSALGHEVLVVGGAQPEMAAALGGARVRWRAVRSLPGCARAVWAQRDMDIVHAHMSAAELACLPAVTVRGTPLVATRHFAAHRGAGSLPGRVVAPLVGSRLAAQISVSRFVAESIESPSTVVLPGVEEPLRRPDDQRDATILMAQRLEPEKDGLLGLRAFAASGLARRGWRLDIAGSGSQQALLHAEIGALGLGSSARLLGPRRDTAELMTRAGILLATAPRESLGLSVMEAMACGLPVVAASAGGHLETVGLAGERWLFAPGDVRGAAEALRGLALDPQAAREHARAQRAVHERLFSPARQAARVDALYRSVLR